MRSDASMARLVLAVAARGGRVSARGSGGAGAVKPGGCPWRSVERHAARSVARLGQAGPAAPVDVMKSSSALSMLRPYVIGGAPRGREARDCGTHAESMRRGNRSQRSPCAPHAQANAAADA